MNDEYKDPVMHKVFDFLGCEVWADETDPSTGASSKYEIWTKSKDAYPGNYDGEVYRLDFRRGEHMEGERYKGVLLLHVLMVLRDYMTGIYQGPSGNSDAGLILSHIIDAYELAKKLATKE